jgi:hypothetical protein
VRLFSPNVWSQCLQFELRTGKLSKQTTRQFNRTIWVCYNYKYRILYNSTLTIVSWMLGQWTYLFNLNIFRANAFIYLFQYTNNSYKVIYTQHCYVYLKTLYPGGIRTRVFLFLRQIRCPLRHAARAGDWTSWKCGWFALDQFCLFLYNILFKIKTKTYVASCFIESRL